MRGLTNVFRYHITQLPQTNDFPSPKSMWIPENRLRSFSDTETSKYDEIAADEPAETLNKVNIKSIFLVL